MSNYPKVSQDDYDKAKGQFRLGLHPILNCFRCYGQDHDVDEATEEIVRLAELFGMRVRGADIPINVREKPRRKPTE